MPTPTLSPQMASAAAKIIDSIPQQSFFETVLVYPIVNALLFFYRLFSEIGLPFALGFSIIAVVLLIRKLVDPLYVKQILLTKKMQELRPEMEKIQKEFKSEPQKLQAAQMELYKKHGINPLSGCLPVILQIPLFIAVYQAMSIVTVANVNGKLYENLNGILWHPWLHVNALDPNFFGLNLGGSPSMYGFASVYVLIPLITGLLQWYQFELSLKTQQPVAANLPAKAMGKKEGKKEEVKREEKPAETMEDFSKTFNTQMKFMMPAMVGFFSWSFSVGLSLYWNILTIYSIIQYRNMLNGKKA